MQIDMSDEGRDCHECLTKLLTCPMFELRTDEGP